jgi:hypothetical protein
MSTGRTLTEAPAHEPPTDPAAPRPITRRGQAHGPGSRDGPDSKPDPSAVAPQRRHQNSSASIGHRIRCRPKGSASGNVRVAPDGMISWLTRPPPRSNASTAPSPPRPRPPIPRAPRRPPGLRPRGRDGPVRRCPHAPARRAARPPTRRRKILTAGVEATAQRIERMRQEPKRFASQSPWPSGGC